MNRRTAWLILLGLLWLDCRLGAAGPPPVVWLVDEAPGKTAPRVLRLALESGQEAFFKILAEPAHEQVLAGRLSAGPNVLSLPAADFWTSGGRRRFRLEMLQGAETTALTFELDIRIDGATAAEPTEPPLPPGCRLSVTVDRHMLYSMEKKHEWALTTKTRGEPKEIDYGRFNAAKGRYTDLERASLPVMALPFMLYRALRKNHEQAEARRRAAEIRRVKQITLSIPRPAGPPATAFVTLRLVAE